MHGRGVKHSSSFDQGNSRGSLEDLGIDGRICTFKETVFESGNWI
jgi:hypothetical protein